MAIHSDEAAAMTDQSREILDQSVESAKPTVPVLHRTSLLSDRTGTINEDNKNWESGRIPVWLPPG